MTEKIASELLVERLIAWDVDTVFCLPGDGINGIMHPARAADRRPAVTSLTASM
jgi:thiamine pyrophosphate-dependent acetolactate synthase large subunit-like protein